MSKVCQFVEDLFAPDVRWIAVMNQRNCNTGIMAFGYPEDRYGYTTYKVIGLDDIPLLVRTCEQRGFIPRDLRCDEDFRSFSYSTPNAKWWTEFEFGIKFND